MTNFKSALILLSGAISFTLLAIANIAPGLLPAPVALIWLSFGAIALFVSMDMRWHLALAISSLPFLYTAAVTAPATASTAGLVGVVLLFSGTCSGLANIWINRHTLAV